MAREFTDFENLQCVKCEKMFLGRRPANGGEIICSECHMIRYISEIEEGNEVSEEIRDNLMLEFGDGGKEDGERGKEDGKETQ